MPPKRFYFFHEIRAECKGANYHGLYQRVLACRLVETLVTQFYLDIQSQMLSYFCVP